MHLRTDTSRNSHFAQVPTISKPRNAFSIADKHATTVQFDYLYPMYVKMIYPGDTISAQFKALSRLTTQIRPLFDDLYIDLHAWYVPLRLVQTNWARFQFNAQPSGPSQDNSSLTTPSIDLTGLTTGFTSKSLYDYLGYPTLSGNLSASTEHINNYYARAYNLIWNTNYRDENLQNAVVVDLDEGPDNPADYVLKKRGKRHDKFTSGLPWQQKGTAVTLPLGTSAPIITTTSWNPTTTGSAIQWSVDNGTQNFGITVADGTAPVVKDGAAISNPGGNQFEFGNNLGSSGLEITQAVLTAAGARADLANATAATVNAWRQSIAIQHLLEADARGGTRDVEAIQHRWGVTVPDFRLQRPEYLGGASFDFDGRIVPQTSETGTTPQGYLTQFSESTSALSVNHSFQEHGVFMILVSHRSNITYQQGLARELSYRTRFDMYQPEFANLGEVAMKNKEIYFTNGGSTDNAAFAYNEYGYELRYGENRISGEMRSNFPTSLDSMVLADDYASLPTLSSGWIESNTAIGRNIAVQPNVADPIQINSLITGRISRTMPMFSIPGLTRL